MFISPKNTNTMVTVDLNNRTTTIGAKLTDAMSYIIPISLTQCFSLNGN